MHTIAKRFFSSKFGFSPRANRFMRGNTPTRTVKRPTSREFRRVSWTGRVSARARSRREMWLRHYLDRDYLEGGVPATSVLTTNAKFFGIRRVRRSLALASISSRNTPVTWENSFLYRNTSSETDVFLKQQQRSRMLTLIKKRRIRLGKKRGLRSFRPKTFRTSRSRSVISRLGRFRSRIKKLTGAWFFRRRLKVRRRVYQMLRSNYRSSSFGLWFNSTKTFNDLRSIVSRKYADYTRRSVHLSKNLPTRRFGSGIFTAVTQFGRVDLKPYRSSFSYFNNKSNMVMLSDFFTYQQEAYLPVSTMYPEALLSSKDSSGLDSSQLFDLTLFESRTAFWESYIGTPTAKASWVGTVFKTVASNIFVVPTRYKARFNSFLANWSVEKPKPLTGKLATSLYVLRKRYFRKSWRVVLRLKFERFIFNRVRFPVYIWFHNIWGLFFKRFYKWRKFEHKVVSRFVKSRRRNQFKALKLRVNWFKMLIRSLGLLGLISGSIHCFTYVFSFLLIKFRKHWQVLKLIKRYLRRCVRVHKTITGIRVAISGRFTGQMRARKNIFKIGGKIRYMNYLRRLTYVLFSSQTPWGVFGIRMWVQFKPKRVRFIDDDLDKVLKKSYACGGLLKRKSLLRYSRQTMLELNNCGFSLKYYTNDDIDKKRHLEDIRLNYATKGAKALKV